jgi:hypothetical protein
VRCAICGLKVRVADALAQQAPDLEAPEPATTTAPARRSMGAPAPLVSATKIPGMVWLLFCRPLCSSVLSGHVHRRCRLLTGERTLPGSLV